MWRNKLIFGKKCAEQELREKFKKIIKIIEIKDFTVLFCRMFNFEEYVLNEYTKVDFIIDLDAHLIYAPLYGGGYEK